MSGFSKPGIPLRVFCPPTGIRTQTVTILSRLPLPVGLWGAVPRTHPSYAIRNRAPRLRFAPYAVSDAAPYAAPVDRCEPRVGQNAGFTRVWSSAAALG